MPAPPRSTAQDPSTDAPCAPRRGDAYVQSLARGLAVLRSFAADAPSQTLSAAAARAGLSRAGARRVLLTLQQLGYVESDGRQFRLTVRVLELGTAYLDSQPVWRLARPVMEDLWRAVRTACSATVLDGAEAVLVEQLPAPQGRGHGAGPGRRQPAWRTAPGRVLLAGLPDDELRARLASALPGAAAADAAPALTALLAILEQVRQEGHALVDSGLEDGAVALAVPLRDRSGHVMAALGLGAPDPPLSSAEMRRRLLPRLLEAATCINELTRMQR